MTEKLYDISSYKKSFEARVVDIFSSKDDKTGLILDKTVFFPEEGGQTSDRGIIRLSGEESAAFYHVFQVEIDKENVITHFIDRPLSEVNIKKGDKIFGEIDFSHRFSNMQNHTGEHIFSGLVKKYYDLNNVGFHLSDNSVTMDYDGILTKEEIERVEADVNRVIYENIEVEAYYPKEEELLNMEYRSKIDFTTGVRIVKIGEYDTCACCAPHVKRTGEIGILKVIDFIKYKNGTRLFILCGSRAFFDIREKTNTLNNISRSYSTSYDLLFDVLKKEQERLIETSLLLDKKIKELLITEGKRLILENKDKDLLILFSEEDRDIPNREAVNALKEEFEGFILLFIKTGLSFAPGKESFRYIISGKERNANEINNILKEKLNAKGGGKPEMIQGSLISTEDEIRSVLK